MEGGGRSRLDPFSSLDNSVIPSFLGKFSIIFLRVSRKKINAILPQQIIYLEPKIMAINFLLRRRRGKHLDCIQMQPTVRFSACILLIKYYPGQEPL